MLKIISSTILLASLALQPLLAATDTHHCPSIKNVQAKIKAMGPYSYSTEMSIESLTWQGEANFTPISVNAENFTFDFAELNPDADSGGPAAITCQYKAGSNDIGFTTGAKGQGQRQPVHENGQQVDYWQGRDTCGPYYNTATKPEECSFTIINP